jgi:Zn-dependent M16 (insulinase) family peptidase
MLEGCIWRRIRGAGLAYGAYIQNDFRRGQLYFDVYRSPNGYAAWHEARKIIAEISAGKVPFLLFLERRD